jgi:hypothetical protein
MRESPSNVSMRFFTFVILVITLAEYFSIYSIMCSVRMWEISASSIFNESYFSSWVSS